MSQTCSSEVVLKNTEDDVIVPLIDVINSFSEVYQAIVEADVDPISGKCLDYEYIRQQIVQLQQNMEQSEQAASTELRFLDKRLESLIEDEAKHNRDMTDTKRALEDLKTDKMSNEKLLSESQKALDLACTNLNSTNRTLQNQKSRQFGAALGVVAGAGLLVLPGAVAIVAGLGMLIGGGIEGGQALDAIKKTEEEVKKCEDHKYRSKVYDYEFKISQTKQSIVKKNDKLENIRKDIQQMKKQKEALAEFQCKVRSAVQLLGVLSARTSVAERQTRRFILQEPVRRVIEEVLSVTKEITEIEFLCKK